MQNYCLDELRGYALLALPSEMRNYNNAASKIYFDWNSMSYMVLKPNEIFSILRKQPDAIRGGYYYARDNEDVMHIKNWGNTLYDPLQTDYNYIDKGCFDVQMRALTSVQQGITVLRMMGLCADYTLSSQRGIMLSTLRSDKYIDRLILPEGLTDIDDDVHDFKLDVGELIFPTTFRDMSRLWLFTSRVKCKRMIFLSDKLQCELSDWRSPIAPEYTADVCFAKGVKYFSIESPTVYADVLGKYDLSSSKALHFNAMRASKKGLNALAKIKLPKYIAKLEVKNLEHLKYFLKAHYKYHKEVLTIFEVALSRSCDSSQSGLVSHGMVVTHPTEGYSYIKYSDALKDRILAETGQKRG